MPQDQVLTIIRETVWMILKLSAPLLLSSMTLGLIIAIFQAATQINEQTMTFVPKIVGIALILMVAGSWMLQNLVEFFQSIVAIGAGL